MNCTLPGPSLPPPPPSTPSHAADTTACMPQLRMQCLPLSYSYTCNPWWPSHSRGTPPPPCMGPDHMHRPCMQQPTVACDIYIYIHRRVRMIRREDRQKDGRLSGRMIQLAVGTVWMPMVSHSVSGAGAVRSWGGAWRASFSKPPLTSLSRGPGPPGR